MTPRLFLALDPTLAPATDCLSLSLFLSPRSFLLTSYLVSHSRMSLLHRVNVRLKKKNQADIFLIPSRILLKEGLVEAKGGCAVEHKSSVQAGVGTWTEWGRRHDSLVTSDAEVTLKMINSSRGKRRTRHRIRAAAQPVRILMKRKD